jgi:hypothetical protein
MINITPRTIIGHEAIRLAEENTITLRKHADPIDGHRTGITINEARKIAKEDASLVYAVVKPTGWNADPDQTAGYHFADYFDASGNYQGPDEDGVEPTFEDFGSANEYAEWLAMQD